MRLLLGPIVFVLDAWAIVEVLGSPASAAARIGWILLVLALPFVGFAAWLLYGPRRAAIHE